MSFMKKSFMVELLGFLVLHLFLCCVTAQNITTYDWFVQETSYTRLCSTKNILTINGQVPGPTLHARKGDTLIVNVYNQGDYNITLHWHGVKQPRNPWSDGPEYITQCPIQPGANFSYQIILSTEEGTLWWHAHSDWSRATVYGPIIVYPANGTSYPFTQPDEEFTVVLGSWYKGDVMENIQTALTTGGEPNISDAYTINGQPGDLYDCSKNGTTKFLVDYGKTYLLRLVNGVMNEEMFFMVADHLFTVVGMDGAYVKPFTTNYTLITPGQTMDLLIHANKTLSHYYMASRAYGGAVYDNTTTTAIFQYNGNYTPPSVPSLPILPGYNDSRATTEFTGKLKSLNRVDVPRHIDVRLIVVVSMNTLPCNTNTTCEGPDGAMLAASLNNITFEAPTVDILTAYYNNISGHYTPDFPDAPVYNYTADEFPENVITSTTGTRVRVLEYNKSVEIVFQGTNVVNGAENHPMHLHGYSFYAVGGGYGIFNSTSDPEKYNFLDPPELNTLGVPTNGWTTIRFRTDNPGVWFMHCHLERHASWGMEVAFIVKNGTDAATSMRAPPDYLNPC